MSRNVNKVLAQAIRGGVGGSPASNLAVLATIAANKPGLAEFALKGAASSVNWKTFAAGAAAAIVGPSLAKPILHPILKAGASARFFWRDARDEAAAEAEAVKAFRASNTISAADVAQLRAEIADLKATLANATS